MKHFPEELKDEQKFKEIYEFVFFWSRESVDKKVLGLFNYFIIINII